MRAIDSPILARRAGWVTTLIGPHEIVRFLICPSLTLPARKEPSFVRNGRVLARRAGWVTTLILLSRNRRRKQYVQ